MGKANNVDIEGRERRVSLVRRNVCIDLSRHFERVVLLVAAIAHSKTSN